MEASYNGSLDVFPDETLLDIFQKLTPREWGILSSVSKRFKSLTEDSSLWKSVALKNFPDSSSDLPLLEHDVTVVPKEAKKRKLSTPAWQGFYRDMALFYHDAFHDKLKRCPIYEGRFIKCIEIFQDTLYAGTKDKKIVSGRIGGDLQTYETNHSSQICCIKVESTKGGTVIYTGSIDATICVWNATFQLQATLTGHEDSIAGIEITDKNLISASTDNTIRIWDKHTHKCVQTLTGLNQFSALAYSSDKIIAGTYGGLIGIWQLKDGAYKFVKEIKAIRGPIITLKIWRGHIFCGSKSHPLYVLDLNDYSFRVIRKIENSKVFDIHDGKICHAYSKSKSAMMRFWNAETFEEESQIAIKLDEGTVDIIHFCAGKIFYNYLFQDKLILLAPEGSNGNSLSG